MGAPSIGMPKGLIRPESAAAMLGTPRRRRLLEHIWQRTSLARAQFATLYRVPLERYAELVQQFPASESHHHAYPGGMLDHGLEILAYALKLRQSHLLPVGDSPEAQPASGISRRRALEMAGAALIAAPAGWLAAVWGLSRRPVPIMPPGDPMRFSIDAPEGSFFGLPSADPHPAVSPDGRRLAFRALDQGRAFLWVQTLGRQDARRLTAEGAFFPFWSPDGQFIGFVDDGRVKRIAASGLGAPQDIAIVPAPGLSFGGTWSPDGTIVFAAADGLYRVPASGGEAEPLTRIDEDRGEHVAHGHRFPVMLPDGTRFLYLVLSDREEQQGLYLGSLDAPGLKQHVVATDANGAFGTDGDGRTWLFYMRRFELLAQPFDVERGALTGTPIRMAHPIQTAGSVRLAPFATAGRALVYRPGTRANTRLVWMDRRGIPAGIVGDENQRYSYPALSPDGTRLATVRFDPRSAVDDIWLFDLARAGIRERLTAVPESAYVPMWTPEGTRVIYSRASSGVWDLYWRAASTRGDEEVLATGAPTQKYTRDVTRDVLLFHDGVSGIWTLPLGGDSRAATELLPGGIHARVSPNGRWLAYSSDEAGEGVPQVYVTTFPMPGDAIQISTAGGVDPQWRHDGGELYYIAPEPDRMLMAVEASTGETFAAGTPVPLFRAAFDRNSFTFGSAYSPALDGQRFIVAEAVESEEPTLVAMLNWTLGEP